MIDGVQVYGEDVWPLHTPRSAPGKQLPWQASQTIEHASHVGPLD